MRVKTLVFEFRLELDWVGLRDFLMTGISEVIISGSNTGNGNPRQGQLRRPARVCVNVPLQVMMP